VSQRRKSLLGKTQVIAQFRTPTITHHPHADSSWPVPHEHVRTHTLGWHRASNKRTVVPNVVLRFSGTGEREQRRQQTFHSH
jgi:hypothetical protein